MPRCAIRRSTSCGGQLARIERAAAARHHPHAAVQRDRREVRRDDRERAAQRGQRLADAVRMRDRARDVQRHRADRRRAAPRRRDRTPACTAPSTGRPDRCRSSTIRSNCSVLSRTNSKPSPMRSLSRGSSSAPRCTRCRYLRAMSTTARSISASVTDFDRRMLEQLLGRAAVAAADDQRALGRGMRQRRHVDEILVIEELVLLATS